MNTTKWEFKWSWCETCDTAMIKCPKCGNNCCNAMYGPAEGTVNDENWDPSDPNKCPVCPLTYQHARLAWANGLDPTKEQLEQEGV